MGVWELRVASEPCFVTGGLGNSHADEPWLRETTWYRRISVLDRIAFVVSVLASIAEVWHLYANDAALGGYLALIVTVVGIGLSRSSGWWGLGIVLLGSLVAAVFWDPLVPWTIAIYTVFSLTLRGAPRFASGAVVGIVVYAAVVYAYGIVDPVTVIALSSALAAAAMGSAIRNRDRYWRSLEQRARDAISSRESEANRRVAEERLRIARDLHDVVGHEVAVVSIHLGLAEASLPDGSERSRAALESARSGVQSVLHETQSILEVLRRGGDDDLVRTSPSAARLPELVESFRRVGMTIDSSLDLPAENLSPTVDTALYRISQEALTNAQRHGAGRVEFSMTVSPTMVVVEVSNDKRGFAQADAGRRGFGLLGMRERAQSAGGTLVVGGDDRRFVLTATVRTDGGTVE